MSTTPLRLGDLLDDPRLGLQLVSGGSDEARDRLVLGAHSIELERPGRWLEPGWLVCTTGLVVHDRPEAQRALVRELGALGAAALGFGVGVRVDEVPDALLEEAAAVDLPVVSIPESLRFYDLISQVTCALHDSASSSTARIEVVQRYLFDAVLSADPRRELLARLAEVSESAVALVNDEGRPIVFTGSIPWELVEPGLIPGHRHVIAHQAAGCSFVAAPVAPGQRTTGLWLVIGRRAPAPHPLAKSFLRSALTTLESVDALERAHRGRDRVEREAVLQKLYSVSNDVLEHIAREQATALGVDVRVGPVVVALEPRDPDVDVAMADVLEILQVGLEDAGVSYLATDYQRGAWALVNASRERALLVVDAILARRPELVGGTGRPVHTYSELQGALVEAQLQSDQKRLDAGARVQGTLDLNLAALLLSGVDHRKLRTRASEVLAPISTNEPLLSTLAIYFMCNMNVTEASARLHLHPNSLRYRLTRIEQLLDRSLRDPSTITDLQLALTIRSLDASAPDRIVA